jgi:hypothetical protein
MLGGGGLVGGVVGEAGRFGDHFEGIEIHGGALWNEDKAAI